MRKKHTHNSIHYSFRKRNKTNSKLIELQKLYKKNSVTEGRPLTDQSMCPPSQLLRILLVCICTFTPQTKIFPIISFPFFLFFCHSIHFSQSCSHSCFLDHLHQSSSILLHFFLLFSLITNYHNEFFFKCGNECLHLCFF